MEWQLWTLHGYKTYVEMTFKPVIYVLFTCSTSSFRLTGFTDHFPAKKQNQMMARITIRVSTLNNTANVTPTPNQSAAEKLERTFK